MEIELKPLFEYGDRVKWNDKSTKTEKTGTIVGLKFSGEASADRDNDNDFTGDGSMYYDIVYSIEGDDKRFYKVEEDWQDDGESGTLTKID